MRPGNRELQRRQGWGHSGMLPGDQAVRRRSRCPGSLMHRYYLRAAEDPWAAASAADSLVTWKHSRMSPTLTSLKFAIPRPHSNPVRTSLASSLKRFRELSLDV